jgi:putative endonuclease
MVLTSKRKTGDRGEELACQFIVGKGHRILARNYLKKCGEIDIVSTKNGVLHFIEVKSVTKKKSSMSLVNDDAFDEYRAEDNLHQAKLTRLSRTVNLYLSEHQIDDEVEWQIDAVIILLGEGGGECKVRFIENINL